MSLSYNAGRPSLMRTSIVLHFNDMVATEICSSAGLSHARLSHAYFTVTVVSISIVNIVIAYNLFLNVPFFVNGSIIQL